MPSQVAIREMNAADWPEVLRIYLEGIATGHATFETRPQETWNEWLTGTVRQACLVAEDDGAVCGWVSLRRVSERDVYRGVAELTIYVDAAHRCRGVGSRLMESAVEVSERAGVWTLESRIFPENSASIRLHAKHGFRQVGVRERLGRMESPPMSGVWRDVLLLERRSTKVGV